MESEVFPAQNALREMEAGVLMALAVLLPAEFREPKPELVQTQRVPVEEQLVRALQQHPVRGMLREPEVGVHMEHVVQQLAE